MPFTQGHTISKGIGRPKGSKNLLPLIREKVLNALDKRISIDKSLKDVSTEDLLKFAQSIMPKDISVKHSTDVQYISHTPRPLQCVTVLDSNSNSSTKELSTINTISNVLKNDNDNSNVSIVSIDNDTVNDINTHNVSIDNVTDNDNDNDKE